MRKTFILALILSGISFGDLMAQNQRHPLLEAARIPPRSDDHFWRRKVVNRIDLEEKINKPLALAEDRSIYGPDDYAAFGERDGIVAALMNGLKSGKYLAYNPDSLHISLTYDDAVAIAKKKESKQDTEESWGSEEEGGMEDFEAGEDGMGEDFGDDMGEDEMPGDENPFGGGGGGSDELNLAPYEVVIEFIEDRIFDKNRSDMIYDIQYIRLMWVDVAEVLPDDPYICFRYSDVLDTLEDTQWKNKYNDAEYRNLREVFELRMFNSVIYNVSGIGPKTLEEADFRRNQLVEYEHHLWHY